MNGMVVLTVQWSVNECVVFYCVYTDYLSVKFIIPNRLSKYKLI